MRRRWANASARGKATAGEGDANSQVNAVCSRSALHLIATGKRTSRKVRSVPLPDIDPAAFSPLPIAASLPNAVPAEDYRASRKFWARRAAVLEMSRLKVHTSRMFTIRGVLAAIIALWIAILPAVGAVAFASQSPDVAMSDDSGMPCNKPTDDDKAFTACALKCFQLFAENVASPLSLPARRADMERLFVTETFYSRPIVPPFRPPAA